MVRTAKTGLGGSVKRPRQYTGTTPGVRAVGSNNANNSSNSSSSGFSYTSNICSTCLTILPYEEVEVLYFHG
jgi:hypothetical protein